MSTVRGGALRLADNLRGGKVAKELTDIGASMTAGRTGVTRSSGGLAQILSHATRHVPFYRRTRSTRLSEYPVMNKAGIREHGDEMLAAGFADGKVYPATTSGSTGTPFRILRDGRKQLRIQAEAVYWGRLAGYELGQPLFHLKVWSGRNRLSRVALLSRNVIPVDVAQLQDADYVAVYEEMGRRRSPVSIVAYTSALEAFLRAVQSWFPADRPHPVPRLAGIITQSEAMSAELRAAVAGRLGRMPYARYGLEELGIVAQQVPGSADRYLVNSASHFVEILDLDHDMPAEPGETGRIVVTDLINSVQPMIRYDTGDLGSFAVDSKGSPDSTWLQTVSGRRLDQLYDAQDRPLSLLLMNKIWWQFPEIRQHQVVQRGRGDYLIRLNVDESFTRGADFLAAFTLLMGEGSRCELEYTNEALVLSSGKRKSAVSHYRPVAAAVAPAAPTQSSREPSRDHAVA